MHFHIIMTPECNMQCRYCHGKCLEDMDEKGLEGFEIIDVPPRISYDIGLLKQFIEKDPGAWVSFYGGEPTMEWERMKEIMDTVSCRGFLMQTNGMTLDKLEPEYLNRFNTILVSLDGDETITDHCRGEGTYSKVMENVKQLRESGFRGELIARMVISEQSDVEKDVRHLVEAGFTSVHWQLDALFFRKDFEKRDFRKWARSSYMPGIVKLAIWWVNEMERTGKVLKLYPFIGIMESLLSGDDTRIRCGSGWKNYSIVTDGNIAACPAMLGMKDFYVGHISRSHPLKMPRSLVGEPCTTCDIYHLCGGRCLFSNKTMLWGRSGFNQVCETVRQLIEAMQGVLPRVKRLIAQRKIKEEDFEYHKYNGAEIIP
ncbi:MAG: TIGR04084 family radical SAM/SPASM domain-containing protein [Candidatus Aenigmarchaeota archaeon]